MKYHPLCNQLSKLCQMLNYKSTYFE